MQGIWSNGRQEIDDDDSATEQMSFKQKLVEIEIKCSTEDQTLCSTSNSISNNYLLSWTTAITLQIRVGP